MQLEASLRAQGVRITELEEALRALGQESDALWPTSRKRWQNAIPDKNLTWGANLTGDAFIDKVAPWESFGPDRAILELGPGYGRLLRSILSKRVEFSRYVGVDISEKNVEYLTETYPAEAIRFLQADAEHCCLEFGYDLFLSSLTMKHLYPTFEACLSNLARFANVDCRFFFDLIEGEGGHLEHDGVTYVRRYSRDEVGKILDVVGLRLIGFDEVHHNHDHVRLLVVAEKAG